jgi:hypothetical protein
LYDQKYILLLKNYVFQAWLIYLHCYVYTLLLLHVTDKSKPILVVIFGEVSVMFGMCLCRTPFGDAKIQWFLTSPTRIEIHWSFIFPLLLKLTHKPIYTVFIIFVKNISSLLSKKKFLSHINHHCTLLQEANNEILVANVGPLVKANINGSLTISFCKFAKTLLFILFFY